LKYALVGYPLSHSMSPQIHKKLFEESKHANATYVLREITAENFDDQVRTLFEYDGFNVTIPHKISIIKHLDELDETAARYNAVNTVKCCNGKNIGYNTDVQGFLSSIKLLGASLTGNVAVLGCGGTGRMMAIETALAGGNLTVAVRRQDFSAAQTLADDIYKLKPNANITITDIQALQGDFDLISNATPVGMYPNINDCPISDNILKNVPFVFDAVYNPTETVLLKTAKSYGAKTLSGLSMLIRQAAAAHEIWYGDRSE